MPWTVSDSYLNADLRALVVYDTALTDSEFATVFSEVDALG